MKKILFLAIITIITFIVLVSAVTWSPQGNVDLKKRYNITNGSYIFTEFFDGNLTWTDLYSYPAACPGSGAITTLGDSVTCSDLWVDVAGDVMTGNLTNVSYLGINTITPDKTLQVVGDSKFGDDNTNYLSLATDGELLLTGTARVTRHLRVGAGSWNHGASAPTAGFEGVFPTLDFDAASDDECHFVLIVPHRWDSSVDVEFVVDWFYDGSQDNGTVNWALEYKSIKAGEAITGSGTTINKTSVGNHTTGQMVRTTFTTKILAANLECCDSLGLRLYRDVSEDTLATDARGINSHFHFTQNKLGKAT